MRAALAACAFLFSVFPFATLAADAPAQCFPSSIDGLSTRPQSEAERARMAALRNTVVAGYGTSEYALEATTYLYDRAPNPSLEDEYTGAWQAVAQLHSDLDVARSGEVTLPIGATQRKGMLGIGLWSVGETDYGSFLWVEAGKSQYLKVRVTYVRPEDDAQTAGAMRLAMDSLNAILGASCKPQ